MKKLYISLLLLGSIGLSYGQDTPEERLQLADKLFNRFEFSDAANHYHKLTKGVKTDNYINLQLAECYYNMFNTVEAAKWYGKAIEANPNLDAEIYYRYAQMLKASGRYEASNDVMKKYAELKPDDQRSKDFLSDPNYIPQLRSQEALFTYEDSGMNDLKYSDFAGILTEDNTFYFTSARTESKKKYGWNEQPYLDIYSAKYDPEEGKFKDIAQVTELNSKLHDGPVSITADGQTMYFSSESFRSRKFTKNVAQRLKEGKVSLYRAKFDGKKWKDVQPVSFNSAEYMVSNPSISGDGKTLYFASDMPGGFGGMDIWKVSINEDGSYGEPVNLGERVNTEGRESFPFIDSINNKLYFASDSRKGFGGLDVYSLDLETPGSEARNLGDPVNTPKDDFAMSFYPNKGIGFLSTNRVGRDDIYRVKPICLTEIITTVKNSKTGELLKDAQITIFDHDNNPIETRYTDNYGIVRYEVDCNRSYSLKVTKADYEGKDIELAKWKGGKQPVEVNLRPIELIVIVDKIVLDDIFFEFDKSNITQQGAFELNKLVQILERNPNMKIKIESHTDSKGSDAYNLKLSERRAMSTLQYVKSQGISGDRLEAQGYGESQPKIDCGENCTPEEDATNRRSEFIITQK
ncbi:OmpA family protein [Flavobacterium sp. I3-2]|uniref:OmpA family protein n=1 Tax=Flavobacterium sp. I3-2 TaxID=2748319 RepID=UPI0015B1F3AD|nr:OmpA family protein [Flavobacterium sp. I3-2]